MKIIEKDELIPAKTHKVTCYISEDGKIFKTKKECEKYELLYYQKIYDQITKIYIRFENNIEISICNDMSDSYLHYYQSAFKITNKDEFIAFLKICGSKYEMHKEYEFSGDMWYFIFVDENDWDYNHGYSSKPPIYIKSFSEVKIELYKRLEQLNKKLNNQYNKTVSFLESFDPETDIKNEIRNEGIK